MTLAELKTLEQLLMKFQDEFGGNGSDIIDVDQDNAVTRVVDAVGMVACCIDLMNSDEDA